jgi:small GTP-binding protein
MMPANLPPDYYAAERRYREAGTAQEKIDILREMLAIMPKHKGTEHLQGDLKRRIAKLNSQAQKKQGTTRSSGLDHIPREGAGQVVLVGSPNAGKSSILSGLTNASSEVADYPFSTSKPVQGMMVYEDIKIQLVDLPPISQEYTESWVFNIIRLADLVLLVIDLSSSSPGQQVIEICDLLKTHKIELQREGQSRPQAAVAHKSTLLVGTKADLKGTKDRAESLIKTSDAKFPSTFISMKNSANIAEFQKLIFESLRVIRIYTKTPGKKSDFEKPYILPKGTTVFNAAKAVHKDFTETMRYARIWGSDKYDGQRVERDHVMEDKDIIEIHTR